MEDNTLSPIIWKALLKSVVSRPSDVQARLDMIDTTLLIAK